MAIANLLQAHLHLFNSDNGVVLDLACGQGQNGLALHQSGIDVLFADIKQAPLSALQDQQKILKEQLWQADFESKQDTDRLQLAQLTLQGVIVFRYLHRPLFDHIKQAVKSGGIVIYETFTVENRQFGRPHRTDFLLKENELKTIFKDWEILFYFEGIKRNPDRAIAQIVCKKP
ncbi:tellurite resistance protein [Psychromonas sp. GE-S-Ul-11]|uniref:tellurite resistance protein n=1 Tax=Psychromonas sp. GE-S-Ul-11 TaxID=3241170 RepID=UPI00390CBA8E